MEVHELEKLIPRLMMQPQHDTSLRDSVQHIRASPGGVFQANVELLRSFPNLKCYDGTLILTQPKDVDVLAGYQYQNLTVDLRHLISQSKQVLPLVKRTGTITFTNLFGCPKFTTRIDRGRLQFLGSGAINLEPWSDLLTSDHVHTLDIKHCDANFIRGLPHNIEMLDMSRSGDWNLEDLRPRHQVSLIGTPPASTSFLKKPSVLHSNVRECNLPLSYAPHEALSLNSHLKSVGWNPNPERMTQSRIFDTVDQLFQDYPQTGLCLWTSSMPLRYRLDHHFSQRIHLMS
jgi:hypothetical protein